MRRLKIISAAFALAAIAGLSGQARADSWSASSAYGTGSPSVGLDGHYSAGRAAVGVLLGQHQTLTSTSISSIGSATSYNVNGNANSFEGNMATSNNAQSPVSTNGTISQ
jgi:hypothetical protein